MPYPALRVLLSNWVSAAYGLQSGRLAEGQIDAVPTDQGVISLLERHDAMIPQSGGTSPDHHVTMSQWHAAWPVDSMRPSMSAKKFNVMHPFSRGVVENDADRVTMPRTKAAHAVTQVDSIEPARALHRPMVDGEHHGVTLSERDHFRT